MDPTTTFGDELPFLRLQGHTELMGPEPSNARWRSSVGLGFGFYLFVTFNLFAAPEHSRERLSFLDQGFKYELSEIAVFKHIPVLNFTFDAQVDAR